MLKKRYVVAAIAAIALAAGVLSAAAGTGNGAPNGQHYTLNIHGVANGQGFNGNNKNDIWVPLWGNCKINLSQASTFQVTQPDCVNNPPAGFQLPNPCADQGCTTFAYQVWARALTPGMANMYSCFTDTTTSTTYCNTGFTLVVNAKHQFTNVSQDLLTVCDETGHTAPLFANNEYDYFWQYDNQGLRLAQLRFYPIPGDASGVGSGCTYGPTP